MAPSGKFILGLLAFRIIDNIISYTKHNHRVNSLGSVRDVASNVTGARDRRAGSTHVEWAPKCGTVHKIAGQPMRKTLTLAGNGTTLSNTNAVIDTIFFLLLLSFLKLWLYLVNLWLLSNFVIIIYHMILFYCISIYILRNIFLWCFPVTRNTFVLRVNYDTYIILRL